VAATFYYPKPPILESIPLNRHAVIEASAGTGKTYTLEHLIVEIMLNASVPRIGVEQILVVTYTERATSELRSRVRGVLERILMQDSPGSQDVPHWVIDERTRRFLELQVFSFDRAPIHTIHGFCRRILSENAFYLQKLFDQSHEDAGSIFDRAFTRTLRRVLAVDPKLKLYLQLWLENYSFDSLKFDLMKICTTPAELRPQFEPGTLDAALRDLYEHEDIEWAALQSLSDGSTSMDFQAAQYSATQMIGYAKRLVEGEELPHLIAEADQIVPGWQCVRNVPNFAYKCPRLTHVLMSFPPLRAAILQAFKPAVLEAHQDEKNHGAYDFDDMLLSVWKRLQDPSHPTTQALIQVLRARYRFALVDEFQDTDEIQWDIFRSLFFESKHNKLYVIGDPKQAIYGFRGADVHTYVQARDTMCTDGEIVDLRQNYRSTPKVIDAYNAIFDKDAPQPFFGGKIIYKHPVEAGKKELRAIDKEDREIIPFQMLRVIPESKQNYEEDITQSYGNYIADEILKILGDEPIFIKDGEDDPGRRVGPSDIYVLARTGREEQRIGQIFRRRGVPFAFYKLQGLFKTQEAREVQDLLRAIRDPYRESNRFKAWITRFFDISIEDLARCRDIPETHPLFDRLVRWHELAQARDFERLFMDVLDRSGIIRREIFYKNSERELTNYQHIFEHLLEASHGSNLTFKDLLERLQRWIDGGSHSEEDDRDIQRLESEREAVQIMTFHKSKGLEADVVFLFGGNSKNNRKDFTTLHWGRHRVLHIGEPYAEKARKASVEEQDEEDRRLLYVGITRARARVVVPFADRPGEIYRFDGMMLLLNNRLDAMRKRNELPEDLFELVQIPAHTADTPLLVAPEPQVEEIDVEQAPHFIDEVRGKSFVISSYSRMKRTSGGYKATSIEDLPEVMPGGEFQAEPDLAPNAWLPEQQLPGGALQGVFLHQILEDLTYSSDSLDFDAWIAQPEVASVFDDNFRRYGIDLTYRTYCETIVYNTLNAPIELPDGASMDRLGQASRVLKEVEFTFPIPEGDWPLGSHPQGAFRIERGWVKGFIDLMFEFDGKVYFADWKSDTLDDYGPALLDIHVANNYGTQASLYGLAVSRMLRLHDKESYDQRFGGYLYLFLRGMGAGSGVYARRPEFQDLCDYETSLTRARIV